MKTLDQLMEHPLLAQATHLGDHAPGGVEAEGFALPKQLAQPVEPEIGADCRVAGHDVGLARAKHQPRSLILEIDRVRRWLAAPGDDAWVFEDGDLMLLPPDGFAAFLTEADGVELAVGVDRGLVRVWKVVPVPYSLPEREVAALVVPSPPIAAWAEALGAPSWVSAAAGALAEGPSVARIAAAGLFARGFVPEEDEDAAFEQVASWVTALGAPLLSEIERAACDLAARVADDAEDLPETFELGADAAARAARRLGVDRDDLQSAWVALKLGGSGGALGSMLSDVDETAADASFALSDALADFAWSEDEAARWSALAWQDPMAWWIPELDA